MRLVDLHPEFVCHGGAGVTDAAGEPIPRTEGVGIILDCPCGNADEEHRLYVPFANPIGPGPLAESGWRGWVREGDTFDTLTLSPSILRLKSEGVGCGWHGHIRAGEVTT